MEDSRRTDWYASWTARNGNLTSGTFSGMTNTQVFETIERENHYPGTEITIQEVIQ